MVDNKQIGIRLPQKDIENIAEYVQKGYASTTTDFIRQAVREKIALCKTEA